MPINIDALQADDRTSIKVYVLGGANEAGEDLPDSAGFIVVGPHSAEFRTAQAKLGARVIALMRESDKKPKDDQSDEQQWTDRNDALNQRAKIVAECCTIGLFGFESGGQAVPFTAQAVSAIFEKRPLWAYSVMSQVESQSAFTKG